jgi:glutathione S-transferase
LKDLEPRVKNFLSEMEHLNNLMEGKKYFNGTEEFSVADIVALCQLLFFKRLGYTFNKFDNLKKYVENNKERKSVINSIPPHWKDTEDKTAFDELIKELKLE